MQFYQKNRKFITHTPRPPPTPVWREGTLREERERKPVISKKADGTGELQSLRRAAPPEPAPGASRHLVPLLAQHPRQLLTRGPDSARPGEASGIPRVSPPRHACPRHATCVPAPPCVSLPRHACPCPACPRHACPRPARVTSRCGADPACQELRRRALHCVHSAAAQEEGHGRESQGKIPPQARTAPSS